ncbi:MAG TPA: DUF397 domain-containing protein [Actinomycetes bacterium]|nr:DUF397 domain-containing protein [Actinomycetes bacterium]
MAELPDPEWRRSSLCANASCVEVAFTSDDVMVRDAQGSTLNFSRSEWAEFLAGTFHGEFDPPLR